MDSMRGLTRETRAVAQLLAHGHRLLNETAGGWSWIAPGASPEPNRRLRGRLVQYKYIEPLVTNGVAEKIRDVDAEGKDVQVIAITERGTRVVNGTESLSRG